MMSVQNISQHVRIKKKQGKHPARSAINVFIGNRIKILRTLKGITQKGLSSQFNPPITQQQLCKYESGRDSLPACMLFETSQILGVTVESFLPLDMKPIAEKKIDSKTLDLALKNATLSFAQSAKISTSELLQLAKTLREIYKSK